MARDDARPRLAGGDSVTEDQVRIAFAVLKSTEPEFAWSAPLTAGDPSVGLFEFGLAYARTVPEGLHVLVILTMSRYGADALWSPPHPSEEAAQLERRRLRDVIETGKPYADGGQISLRLKDAFDPARA